MLKPPLSLAIYAGINMLGWPPNEKQIPSLLFAFPLDRSLAYTDQIRMRDTGALLFLVLGGIAMILVIVMITRTMRNRKREPMISKSGHDLRHRLQTLRPSEVVRIGLVDSIQQAVDSMPTHPARFTFLTAGKHRSMSTEKELAIYQIATDIFQTIVGRYFVRRGSLQILYCDDELRIVIEADEKIDSIPETHKVIQENLSPSSVLANHLGGNLILEISHSGAFIIVEVPY